MTLAPECLDIKWDGASLVVVLVAILIAVPATAVTLWLYRRAVARAMRDSAGERLAADLASDAAAAPVAPLQISAGGDELPVTPSMAASRSAMRGLSGAYALAGFVHSVVTTALWFVLNDVDFRPFRVLLVWLPFAWPVVLGVMLTATTTRAQRYSLTVGYFLVLLMADAGAEVFGLRYQPGFGELFVYWAAVMGLPTLIIALLGNRAWRSVGLVALFLGLAISASLLFGFQALGCLTLTTRSELLLTTFYYLLAALVLGSVLLAGSWLKRSYQAKRTSDQMLVLDGWWLLVTLLQLLFELGPSGLSATAFLLSYVAYKVVLRTALPRVASASSRGSPPSLLLLRVFGYTRRTRGLIDQVGQFWRHCGPINMIGGVDLATSLVEPDELAQFWMGRLRRAFIANGADLQARLAALDRRPDPDGRYRVNEFFCYDNTWQATVRDLARASSAVIMDLRGFGRQNRGCEYELGLLMNEVPLARIVLLIDGSSRREELESLLQSFWGKLHAASPNRVLERPVLQLLLVRDESGTLDRVMSRLFASADALGSASP